MKNQFYEDEYFNIAARLLQARNVFVKAWDKELSKYSVTHTQACVLFIIKVLTETGGRPTPGEIARWLLKEPHTASRIVTRMEKTGLVSKISGRKNNINVALTEKGEQVYNQSLKRESVHKIMSCLSEEERQQMNSFLEKLRDTALKDIAMSIEVPFP